MLTMAPLAIHREHLIGYLTGTLSIIRVSSGCRWDAQDIATMGSFDRVGAMVYGLC